MDMVKSFFEIGTDPALFGTVISREARRFDFLLNSENLMQYQKDQFMRLLTGDFENEIFLQGSLNFLAELISRHYGTQVIVLIDEYDVPLDKAWQNGYYREMINLIRSFFSQVLKTNNNLYFAVITGCLRIARETG